MRNGFDLSVSAHQSQLYRKRWHYIMHQNKYAHDSYFLKFWWVHITISLTLISRDDLAGTEVSNGRDGTPKNVGEWITWIQPEDIISTSKQNTRESCGYFVYYIKEFCHTGNLSQERMAWATRTVANVSFCWPLHIWETKQFNSHIHICQ